MELIAKVRNPYIVEYKEAWVEKVSIWSPILAVDSGSILREILQSRSFP
jgi:hypothetical protein